MKLTRILPDSSHPKKGAKRDLGGEPSLEVSEYKEKR
jgi:hypothetical protein